MAQLEWMDGFDHYTKPANTTFATSDISKKWTLGDGDDGNIGPIDALYAHTPGGQGILLNGRGIRKSLPSGQQASRCYAGWFKFTNALPSNAFLLFMDTNNEQLSLRGDGAGHLLVSRAGTTLFTSTNTVSVGVWYFIEFKATIHNTTGVYEVKVNGTSTNWIPQQTGANTRGTGSNNSANQAQYGLNGGPILNLDDVWVGDDFPGQGRIFTARPAAVGNSSAWASSYGTNWGAVGDILPDGDTTFVQDSTSGHIDLHIFDELPVGSGTIVGIQHNLWARQDTGAQRQIRPKIRSGGTNYSGASVNTGGSYTDFTEAVNNDPNTSAAWTVSGFNAAEFGYELV